MISFGALSLEGSEAVASGESRTGRRQDWRGWGEGWSGRLVAKTDMGNNTGFYWSRTVTLKRTGRM